MKAIYPFILCFCLLTAVNTLKSQGFADTTTARVKQNIFKLNLTALPLRNYSVQYERVINKSISLVAGFRFMPTGGIPFKGEILDEIDEGDEDTREVIEQLEMSNIAITPELRWYIGKKGFGRGFYFAPFYRYANFKTSQLVFDYQDLLLGTENNITLSGKLSANTGGLLLGAQWFLGNTVVLDWWILGAHYGGASGMFTGNSSRPLTQQEQNDLRQELEDLDIPLTRKTVTVNANTATLALDGPWAGIRAGISLGIRF